MCFQLDSGHLEVCNMVCLLAAILEKKKNRKMKLNSNFIQYFITISFCLISVSTANGQIENEKYQTESIYLKGSKYVKNGIEYPIGYWGQHLKKEMEVSQYAVIEYNNFQQKRKTAFIWSTISAAMSVSALFVDDNDIQYGLMLGGLGLSIVSFPISRKAGNSFQKAIWIRNGEILDQ